MIIIYENGQQVVTHPSGVVSKYTKSDLEKRRARQQDELNDRSAAIVRINNEISQIELSIKGL